MMKMRFLEIILVLPLTASALPACRGADVPPFRVSGRPAKWHSTPFASWVPAPLVHAQWIDVPTMTDTQGHALLDTGSPVTVLRPGGNFLDEGLVGPVPCKVDLLGLSLEDPPLLAGDILAARTDLVGIVGADILSRFCLALDYQAQKAALFDDCPQPPDPISPTAQWSSLDVALAGGGILHLSDDARIHVPATRILLPLVVEGRILVALLDTGASSLVLSTGLAADLLASDPDRPVLSGLSVTTVEGKTTGWMTRVRSVAAGGAKLHSVACLVVDAQPLFQGIQAETGADVQVLVGETFLRSFALALDQRTRKLFFAPYLDDSHLNPDEFVFVGLSLEDGPQGVDVAAVYPETDADRQGVEPGDLVISVDGRIPRDAADAARLILTHGVGDTVDMSLRRGSQNLEKVLIVENLLPDYPPRKKRAKIIESVHPLWWQAQRIGVLGPVRPARDISGGAVP